MDLSEAWAPEVNYEEIKLEGILLDEMYDPQPYNNKEKMLCRLYYLKSKDIFAISNNTGDWSVITSQQTIDNCKFKYLNQKIEHSKDTFAEFNDSVYTSYEPEFIVNEVDKIKQAGFLLEVDEKSKDEIYYIDEIDAFIHLPANGDIPYKFESFELRKKYNIPFKDERLHGIF